MESKDSDIADKHIGWDKSSVSIDLAKGHSKLPRSKPYSPDEDDSQVGRAYIDALMLLSRTTRGRRETFSLDA